MKRAEGMTWAEIASAYFHPDNETQVSGRYYHHLKRTRAKESRERQDGDGDDDDDDDE